MKNVLQKSNNPTVDAILKAPIRPIAYQEAPELVQTLLVAENGQNINAPIVNELGAIPDTQVFPKLYDAVPPAAIHELHDVSYYNGVLYSRDGRYFPDNMRVFDKNDAIFRDYNPDHTPYLNLGNHFLIPQLPFCDAQPVEYADPIVPVFFTPRYGHWLIEFLPSLWAIPWLKPLFGDKPLKFLLCLHSGLKETPALVQYTAELFGLEKDAFIIPRPNMLLKKVFFPTKSYMHFAYTSPLAKNVWSGLAERLRKTSTLPSLKRLYLSRKFIEDRPLLHEEQCEVEFEKRGFAIVYLEKLPLADQVKLFATATHVAGPMGTAMHNLVFSPQPEEVKTFFLTPRGWNAVLAFAQIESAYGRSMHTVYGQPDAEPIGIASWSVDLQNLRQALDQWFAL